MSRARKGQQVQRPTAVDLFAGCGGLSEGLRQAGFKVVGAVELEPSAVKTYRLNHDGVYVWERDIREVCLREVRQSLRLNMGDLDLLAGCPPCQGFSTMRTLNGQRRVRDKRNTLTDEYLRFVVGLQPKSLMLENVPGLSEKRRFRDFVIDLEDLGYHITWDVLDAAEYGVPQRRRRLIMLGSRVGPVQFGPKARVRRTVRSAIGSLKTPMNSSDPLHKAPGKRGARIEELIAMVPKDGGSRADLPRSMWLECHKRCNGFKDVYGRMRWDDVAPTMTGGCLNPSKGRFLHPSQNRAITAREAALLQTFPASYKFSLDEGFYSVATMIGNALPPEFIRRHALGLKRVLAAG